MQYMLLATETQDAFDRRDDLEHADAYWAAWSGYITALTESGVLVGAGGLQPPHTATTVRAGLDAPTVQDGPYVESHEQLGGYFVIDVADLDAALQWAARCPSAGYASVEIRPLLPPTG